MRSSKSWNVPLILEHARSKKSISPKGRRSRADMTAGGTDTNVAIAIHMFFMDSTRLRFTNYSLFDQCEVGPLGRHLRLFFLQPVKDA